MNELSDKIIGAAMRCIGNSGPVFLRALTKLVWFTNSLQGIKAVRQTKQPITYKGLEIDEA